MVFYEDQRTPGSEEFNFLLVRTTRLNTTICLNETMCTDHSLSVFMMKRYVSQKILYQLFFHMPLKILVSN